MRSFARQFTLAVALLGTACAHESPTTPAPVRITSLPRAVTAAERQIIQADNGFAFKLLGAVTAETRDTMPNLFVSPLSVALALAMTYNGAAGTTEAAMRGTLGLDSISLGDVNQAYRGLIDLLRNLDPMVRVQLANSIWYRQGFTVEQPFLDANRTYYDASVAALDFASPNAPLTINDWVSRETQGRIPTIVPDVLPDNAMMYLVNAIYFKGDWMQRFDASLTRPGPFRLADGSTAMVPMMTHGKPASVRVSGDAAVLVLELAYGGGPFTMTIVMPHDPAGIEPLVAGLSTERWDGWIARLDSAAREVFLPKLRLENDLTLVSVLKTLGMNVAFDCNVADFTRMHVPREVCITDVKHKTFVDVNEEGTEAAAATSVGIGPTSLPGPITVDRPYLFALRETLSGTILFMGVIRNPAGRQ